MNLTLLPIDPEKLSWVLSLRIDNDHGIFGEKTKNISVTYCIILQMKIITLYTIYMCLISTNKT